MKIRIKIQMEMERESVMYLSSCLSPSLASASPPVAEDGLPLSSSAFSLQVTSNIKWRNVR